MFQDGCQKWWENDFWPKVPDDSAYTLQPKDFIKLSLYFPLFLSLVFKENHDFTDHVVKTKNGQNHWKFFF